MNGVFKSRGLCIMKHSPSSESRNALIALIKHMFEVKNKDESINIEDYIQDLKNITTNCNKYIDKKKDIIENGKEDDDEDEDEDEDEEARGGKRKSKDKSKKVSKKSIVFQKKEIQYKVICGKQMKIYKMPDSRKEYVKYKGELHPISDYKNILKQKINKI